MNIDVFKTREFYNSLEFSALCNCDYCCNYRAQVKSSYPKVAAYLDSLGIDIEKPYETSAMEPDENGILEYGCCQYIVFGTCDLEYYHKIDDVEFRIATSYPSTKIEEENFVIEFFPVKLKYADCCYYRG